MNKLLSIIAGLFAKRVKGHQRDLADEDQDELLDLSEYGTPLEDLPIEQNATNNYGSPGSAPLSPDETGPPSASAASLMDRIKALQGVTDPATAGVNAGAK
jgi:hypothetical protein